MSSVEDKSTKDAIEDIMDDGGIMDDIDDMDDINDINGRSNTCIVKVIVSKITYKDASDMEEPDYEPINSDLIKRRTGLETSNDLDGIVNDLSQSNK